MSVHEAFDLRKIRALRDAKIAEEFSANVPVSDIMAWSGLCKMSVYHIANLKSAKRTEETRGRRPGRHGSTIERNAKICADYLAGQTLEEVSAPLGITRERVRQILQEANITARHFGVSSARRVAVRERKLGEGSQRHARRMFLHQERMHCVVLYTNGLKYREIAAEMGRSMGWVVKTLRHAGAQNRSPAAGKPRRDLTDAQKLGIVRRFEAGEKSESIAAIIGCHVQTVYTIAHKLKAQRPKR